MFNSILDWFDGKKVIIGLFLMWLADKPWLKDFLPDGGVESAVVDILAYVGTILAGLGVVHKGYKYYEDKKEEKKLG